MINKEEFYHTILAIDIVLFSRLVLKKDDFDFMKINNLSLTEYVLLHKFDEFSKFLIDR